MKFLRSKLFRMAIVIVSLAFILTLSRSVVTTWQKGDIVSRRKAELARVEAENRLLRQKLAESQSPDFIEHEAREKLGLTKPGESVVLMPPPAEAAKMLEDLDKPVPNWEQWRRLLF